MWSRAPWGPKKGMGPNKSIKKEPILSKNNDLGRFPSFPEHILCWGHFSKLIFAEGRSTRSLWCLEKIQGPIWRPKDHLVDFPRMSKIMNFKETHYSVRQKIGDAGSISTQNMFPLSSVVPKPPGSPYGATYFCLAENQVFQFFPL